MFRIRNVARSAATLGLVALVALVAACNDDTQRVFGPPTTNTDGIFARYVALGNSITAGFQSSGINDSTQRRAYPVLLAQQMRTGFIYPALAGRGCAPPVNNFSTQGRVGTGSTAATCDLRTPSFTDILNNVGVPGATVADLTAPTGTSASNVLTSLFLGGKSQVQKAIDVDPTFASIWIGNNDVLAAAVSGILVPTPGVSPGITPLAAFQTSFNAAADALIAANADLEGVMIGVVNVTNAPILFPAAALLPAVAPANAAYTAFRAATGYNATGTPGQQANLTVDANCTGSTALVSFRLASAIAAFRTNPAAPGAHPPHVACGTPATGFPAPVGDIFILDPTELATLNTAVTGYNGIISLKAGSLGWAYMNPNVLLDSLRGAGQIPVFPNLGSNTATFGAWVTLDGVHPSNQTHRAITNHIINAINATYNTSLVRISVP